MSKSSASAAQRSESRCAVASTPGAVVYVQDGAGRACGSSSPRSAGPSSQRGPAPRAATTQNVMAATITPIGVHVQTAARSRAPPAAHTQQRQALPGVLRRVLRGQPTQSRPSAARAAPAHRRRRRAGGTGDERILRRERRGTAWSGAPKTISSVPKPYPSNGRHVPRERRTAMRRACRLPRRGGNERVPSTMVSPVPHPEASSRDSSSGPFTARAQASGARDRIDETGPMIADDDGVDHSAHARPGDLRHERCRPQAPSNTRDERRTIQGGTPSARIAAAPSDQISRARRAFIASQIVTPRSTPASKRRCSGSRRVPCQRGKRARSSRLNGGYMIEVRQTATPAPQPRSPRLRHLREAEHGSVGDHSAA